MTPKRRNCLLTGCITVVVLGVIGIIALVIAIKVITNRALSYTDTAPAQLPPLEVTAADIAATQQRWENFFADLAKGGEITPLSLSAREVNALLARQPKFTNYARVTMEGDKLRCQVSMPLDQMQVSALKGRYLNGVVTLKLSVENGTLSVQTEEVRARGQALPDLIMREIRKQNWADKAMNNSEVGAIVQELESITVTNGALVIVPKPPPK